MLLLDRKVLGILRDKNRQTIKYVVSESSGTLVKKNT